MDAKTRLYVIVFGTDTKAGKWFDLILLYAILGSIVIVMIESVSEVQNKYGNILKAMEWGFTIFFTIEYLLRLYIVKKPLKYATSFLGVIDLLAILPTYLTLFIAGSGYLVVIRAIRLLRVFRILKLSRQIGEAQLLLKALKQSRHKILVFFGAVTTLTIIMGTFMYMIEGGQNGFTSIPRSIYWAIVTITTVGYGDISPQTTLGQFFAAVLMLMGYAIIAVPTGIVTAEITTSEMEERARKRKLEYKSCPVCNTDDHELSAKYCKDCGSEI
jgi:voltage-gated potassium channel